MTPKIICPNLKQIHRVLTTLDRRDLARFALRRLSTSRPELDSDQYEVTAYLQIVTYLYEWLKHLNLLDHTQIDYILDNLVMNSNFGKTVDGIKWDWPKLDTKATLSLIDRRYAQWKSPHFEWFVDTETQTAVPDRDLLLVTYISVDVSALFHAKQAWLAKLLGDTHGGSADLNSHTRTKADSGTTS